MTDETTTPTTITKPGYKTTEFWLTFAAMLLGTLYASGLISPDGASPTAKVIAFVAATLTALGYTVARGAAKKA